jgi:drug/metabolite transporter (DMT)-like permease
MAGNGLLLLLACVSGIGFSLIGVAYRLGVTRHIHPLHVVAGAAVVGSVAFGIPAARLSGHVPPVVWVLAVGSGISQYAMMHLVRAALRRGPLAALSCASMLNFILVILYAVAFLGERLTRAQPLAIGCAVVCVLLAAAQAGPAGAHRLAAGGGRARLAYAGILLLLLALNSVMSVAMKDLSARPDPSGGALFARYRDVFLAAMYVSLLAAALADSVIARRRPPSWRATLGLGALAGAGSAVGMGLLSRCVTLPAALVFTVNSVTAILSTACIATVWLGERRSPAWYATLVAGLLAVLFASAGQ